MGVWQNSSQVAQVVQMRICYVQMRICKLHYAFFVSSCAICVALYAFFFNACAICVALYAFFFQRLHNLRLPIGKSNIYCALIANFFPRCAITNHFLNVDLLAPVKKYINIDFTDLKHDNVIVDAC